LKSNNAYHDDIYDYVVYQNQNNAKVLKEFSVMKTLNFIDKFILSIYNENKTTRVAKQIDGKLTHAIRVYEGFEGRKI